VGEEDLALCLLSGGGSALAEVPAGPLTLGDVQETTELLLRSGAPITDVNTVRQQLSTLKGGRLGEAVQGPLVTLVVSDVIGSPLPVIASGPTVPAEATAADAREVLRRYGLASSVPPPVWEHLSAAPSPPARDVPFHRRVEVVADGPAAAEGAATAAERLGLTVHQGPVDIVGEADAAAVNAIEAALPGLTVLAGETTVTVRGAGRGGRNQQAALAAAVLLDGRPGVRFAAMGTDGIDGPTTAAGGMVDGTSAGRMRQAGIDPAAALADNDAHRALAAADDLLACGPTGTNVGDVWLVWGD
jgi:hydroxypyruvate reductase